MHMGKGHGNIILDIPEVFFKNNTVFILHELTYLKPNLM